MYYVAMKCHSLALHLPTYDLPPSGLLYGVEADIKAGVKELINALGLEWTLKPVQLCSMIYNYSTLNCQRCVLVSNSIASMWVHVHDIPMMWLYYARFTLAMAIQGLHSQFNTVQVEVYLGEARVRNVMQCFGTLATATDWPSACPETGGTFKA